MEPATRAWMESRFRRDFSGVRLHTGHQAEESARGLNAHAYALGRDVVFSKDAYRPDSPAGRWVLAHELAHVVQQGGREASDSAELGSSSNARFESQANAAAHALRMGAVAPELDAGSEPALMRLTPKEFQDQLGATPDEKSAITALFANSSFLELWNYLKACAATPAKDLGPLTLKVTPGLGLKNGGVERYGGYSPLSRTLEINPTKPEHAANPSELVDTITHEVIHAVDGLKDDCKAAESPDPPLHGAAIRTQTKKLADVKGTAEEDKLLTDTGPGASNPCEEFIDVNKAAQQIIIQVIRSNIKNAKVGKPTITFLNEILRRDPKALAEYKKCRDKACAEADEAKKKTLIADCSNHIMTKYMPKDLKP
jgi:hypothetical protein